MLSCLSIPTSTYNTYTTVNYIFICGGPFIVFPIFVFYRHCFRNHVYGDLFYYSIETLFQIKRKEDEEKKNAKEGSETIIPQYKKPLYFFSHEIKSNRRRTVMLLFITIFTVTSSLAVFFEGIFLANEFIKPDSNCPYAYDTLDCFGYQSRSDPNPNCYFQCIPGERTPNSSFFFGEAICYRWIVQDITTFDVFGQIGICTGILGAFGLFFQGFLALSMYVFRQPTDKSRPGCWCACCYSCSCSCRGGSCGPFGRPWLAYSYIILYILIFPVGIFAALITLLIVKQGISAFTFVVAFTLFVLSIPSVMIAALDISKAVDEGEGDNNKTAAQNETNAISPVLSATNNQRKVTPTEPKTFSNLSMKTKIPNDTVAVASSSRN